MAIVVLGILILLTLLFTLVDRRGRANVCGVAALIWFAAIGCGWLPGLLLSALQIHPPLQDPVWREHNAIVVLGMGTVVWNDRVRTPSLGYARLHEAARLFQACKSVPGRSCTLLLSGGDPTHHGVSEAESMRQGLGEIGIKGDDIRLEDKSENTYQNAKFSSQVLRRLGFDRVIVVTSGPHLPRALLYFSAFELRPLAAPADHFETPLTPWPTAMAFVACDFAFHEYLGILRFYAYEILGLNK